MSTETLPDAEERDRLSVRMKEYERATRLTLPTRTNTIIRVDGKAFHTYTRGLVEPFDADFTEAMNVTAVALAKAVSGSALAYVQSDEISVLTTDYRNENTQGWLGGVVSKIVSISAAQATASFNAAHRHPAGRGPALFDSRVFTIPDTDTLVDYFAWRQADGYRNSLAMICDHHLGKKATVNAKAQQRLAMLKEAGVDLTQYPLGNRVGRLIVPVTYTTDVTYTDKRTGETRTAENVTRTEWAVSPAPDLRKSVHVESLLPAVSSNAPG